MANATNSVNPVLAQILNAADERAAEYEALRTQMLAKRQATREAANMALDLAKVLQQPEPTLSEAVTKVLAKRKTRNGEDE